MGRGAAAEIIVLHRRISEPAVAKAGRVTNDNNDTDKEST